MSAAPAVSGAREAIAPLLDRRLPTALLALAVMLATWRTAIGNPIAGLDASWGAGLYMAITDGLAFGPDVVFTYGPLGFLNVPVNWDTDLASIMFVWQLLLHFALCLALVWALRRSIGAALATLVAFVAIAIFPFIELPFPIALALCFLALRFDRPGHAVSTVAVAGGLFAAALSLIKLSIGPPVLVMCALALLGARASRGQLATFAAVFVVSFVGLWLASGQALGDLADYATNGKQIISGYSEAMTTVEGSQLDQVLRLLVAVVVAAGFTAGAYFASYRDQRARWFGTAIAALMAFVLFKEGVVRMDAAHLSIYLSTMVLGWLALPWDRTRFSRGLLAAGTVVLVTAALPAALTIRPGSIDDDLNAVAAVEEAVDQTKLFLDPDKRTVWADLTKVFLQNTYQLDDRTLAALEGHSVSVEPWEIAIAWAYDLDWKPLPVFQGYQANTAALDELNAAAVSSETGPERILRAEIPVTFGGEAALAIDGRYPAWDPPAQALAELCHFVPLHTRGAYQVLGRVPDRCSQPVEVGSVEAGDGEAVEVPAPGPGQVVFARVHGAEVSGLEKIRTLLYRARFRHATLDDGASYRLVPDTAVNGLMLRGDPEVTGTGTFAQAPQSETIAITGAGDDLRYDFYAMDVETEAPRPRRGD